MRHNTVATTNTNTPANYYSYLFPDSTVRIKDITANNYYRPIVHHIANVLDIKSPYFNNPFQGNIYTKYTIDSIGIEYIYKRKLNVSVKDTLLIYLYQNTQKNFGYGWVNGPSIKTDYGTDTVFHIPLNYLYDKNLPDAANMKVLKVLLEASDTTTGTFNKVKLFKSDFNVPANGLAVCAVGFKPGYSYVANDTLSKTKNYFAFITHEVKGAGTIPYYTETHSTIFNKADWNRSYIVNTTIRYNYNSLGWNGSYMPPAAFVKNYGLEDHGFWYKISTNDVGIKDELADRGFSLGQNMGQYNFLGSTG